MGFVHDFDVKLAYTRGVRQSTDEDTLRGLFPRCVSVVKTDEATDRAGIDYVVTLRGGAEVLVDAKTREPGARRWWRNGEPEIALEVWSVVPDTSRGQEGKTGWTLSESSPVDYILYTFHPADCNSVFLYPFQALRLAFRRNLTMWRHTYPIKMQDSGGWRSQALFVPETVVWSALRSVSVAMMPPGHSGFEGNPPMR